MGIGFPALNVGAMGAVTGQDLGLASGVLNTARQLGAAIGVAILIATFGGALHAHMSWFADDEIEDIVDDYDMPKPMAAQVIGVDPARLHGREPGPLRPEPGFDEDIVRETAGLGPRGLRLGVPPGGAPGAVGAAADGRAATNAGAGASGGDGGGGRPGPAAAATAPAPPTGRAPRVTGMAPRGRRPPAPSPTRPDSDRSRCPLRRQLTTAVALGRRSVPRQTRLHVLHQPPRRLLGRLRLGIERQLRRERLLVRVGHAR